MRLNNYRMEYECLDKDGKVLMKQKPRFRIQWDYDRHGNVIGYWVWTCNIEATKLKSSFYIKGGV